MTKKDGGFFRKDGGLFGKGGRLFLGTIYFFTQSVIQSEAKNLGNIMVGVIVDVLEILRFALDDNGC